MCATLHRAIIIDKIIDLNMIHTIYLLQLIIRDLMIERLIQRHSLYHKIQRMLNTSIYNDKIVLY